MLSFLQECFSILMSLMPTDPTQDTELIPKVRLHLNLHNMHLSDASVSHKIR